MKPILFLLKAQSPAEMNYGSTELETAALVWALQKLLHYLDHAKIEVITNHTAVGDTFSGVGDPQPTRITDCMMRCLI